ncbi:MAG: DUF6285 domain-containing protein [Actinomycetota bacterium]|nr:DUF6285 domain-containing protein [Actinomycetota bacterium]
MAATASRPTTEELAASVRAFLLDDVVPQVEGRTQFHARVAASVLAMIERELLLGDEQEFAHEARLGALGFDDGAALASAVREGGFFGEQADLLSALRPTQWTGSWSRIRATCSPLTRPSRREPTIAAAMVLLRA